MLNPDKTTANIAIVQNCYSLFGQGDVAGLLAQCTPDIVWEAVGERSMFPLFGVWNGHRGVQDFLATMAETIAFTAFEPKTFHAAADKVFVEGHYDMKMLGSGETASADWQMIFTLRDGMICAFREHTDSGRIIAAYRGAETANIALVKQIYDDFAAGRVEAILGTMDPAIEWVVGGSSVDYPTLGARRGIDGAASFFRDVAEHNTFTSFEPRQIVAMGDLVLALGHYAITAKATGRHFESDWAHAFTIRAGKGVKFQEFTDTAAFLKAARA